MKKYMLYILIGTAILFLFVWTRTKITSLTYEISSAENKIKMLNNEKKQLQVQINYLKSPKRLEQIAETKFKMHKPAPKQIIKMKNIDEVKDTAAGDSGE